MPVHHQSQPLAAANVQDVSQLLCDETNRSTVQNAELETVYTLSLYGWSRMCFYALLVMLVALVLVNSVVIVWLMTVISLSSVSDTCFAIAYASGHNNISKSCR